MKLINRLNLEDISGVILIVLCCIFITGCEDEKTRTMDYPRVKTLPVSEITKEGARYNALIQSPGNEEIIEYGFVWGSKPGQTGNSDRVIMTGKIEGNTFSSVIRSTLTAYMPYYVSCYVKTKNYLVYGNEVTFKSLGSMGPVIKGFTPESAGWGDTVTIYGRHFSYVYSQNKVMFGDISCDKIISVSDTTIKVLVPETIKNPDCTISVEVIGNISTYNQKKFALVLPVINDFFPKTACWGDTIIITGRYLKIVSRTGNYVRLGGFNCPVLAARNDSLKIRVPSELNSIINQLSIKLNDFVLTAQSGFELIQPEITDFLPKKGYWGDTLIISGKNLDIISLTGNYVKLGGFACLIINLNRDFVKVRVPHELVNVENRIDIKLNTFIVSHPLNYELLPPFFTFSPKEGTFKSILTLRGRFNIIGSRNKVFFNSTQAVIKSTTYNTMTVEVPDGLGVPESNLIYSVTPFEVTSSDVFRLKPPLISSFSPATGGTGTPVTIKGKYFGTTNIVKFGTATGTITEYTDTTIVATVPAGVNGPVKISVTTAGQTVISETDFLITNPFINDFYPKSGTYNQEITVTGENFTAPGLITSVNIRGYGAPIKILTNNLIVFTVPEVIDSIPGLVEVKVGTLTAKSAESFNLLPPEIESISSPEVTPGGEIVISGKNFNPRADLNKLPWDIYDLKVVQATGNTIIAVWPVSLPRGTNSIKLSLSGYTRYSQPINYASSPWRRINSPQLRSNCNTSSYCYNNMFIAGISIGGEGYLCSPVSEKMFRFSPATESWTEIVTNIPFYLIAGLTLATCKDTIYSIWGNRTFYSGPGIYMYDKSVNKWNEVSRYLVDVNGISGAVFSLNDKIYAARSIIKGLNTFYELDPQNNYTWTAKAPVPYIYGYPASFTVAGKCYLLYADKQFWMYDPDMDQWFRKNDFPGTGGAAAPSFSIGNYGYFLGLVVSGSDNNYLWRYDPETDTWTNIGGMPGKRAYATSLVINGKAYIGYGYYGTVSNQLYDFYEFDPSLLK